MSEYIEIESEITEDPMVLRISTNLPLSLEDREVYHSIEEMEEGSAVAQALSFIEGIEKLEIDNSDMLVTRNLGVDWHIITAEVTAVLKDFFL